MQAPNGAEHFVEKTFLIKRFLPFAMTLHYIPTAFTGQVEEACSFDRAWRLQQRCHSAANELVFLQITMFFGCHQDLILTAERKNAEKVRVHHLESVLAGQSALSVSSRIKIETLHSRRLLLN